MLSVRRNQPSAFVHGMQTSPHIVQIPARGRFADIETNEVFRRLVENERDILRLVLDTFEGLKTTYPPKRAQSASRNCSRPASGLRSEILRALAQERQ